MRKVTRRRFLEGSAMGIAATGLGVSSLCAQDWARQAVDKSPRRHESVQVKYGARSVDTFIAYPQSQGKSPAVVLIHDVIALPPGWKTSPTGSRRRAIWPSLPICCRGGLPRNGRRPSLPMERT